MAHIPITIEVIKDLEICVAAEKAAGWSSYGADIEVWESLLASARRLAEIEGISGYRIDAHGFSVLKNYANSLREKETLTADEMLCAANIVEGMLDRNIQIARDLAAAKSVLAELKGTNK